MVKLGETIITVEEIIIKVIDFFVVGEHFPKSFGLYARRELRCFKDQTIKQRKESGYFDGFLSYALNVNSTSKDDLASFLNRLNDLHTFYAAIQKMGFQDQELLLNQFEQERSFLRCWNKGLADNIINQFITSQAFQDKTVFILLPKLNFLRPDNIISILKKN